MTRTFTVTEFRRTDPDGQPIWEDEPDPMDRDANKSPLRSEADCKALATRLLRENMHADGFVMDDDPLPGEPTRVRLTGSDPPWEEVGAYGDLDGLVIVWTATGSPATTDTGNLLSGQIAADGVYRARLTEAQRTAGGTVRARHGLDCDDVIVTAWDRHGEPIGYLLAFEIDDNEVQVEVFADTFGLDVARRS